jgi:TolB protein
MKRMWRFVGALALASGLTACEPIDLDDGGGGGGGGNVLFTRGFVFVREADRNVYVVDDQGDANSPQRLTTSGGASHPSVSRNGRSAVYVFQAGTTFELRTVPTDASANPSTVLASGGTQCTGCTNFRFPAFNASGTVIVFAFNRGTAGSNYALGRVNADGSGFQELTNQPGLSFGAPSFFPDGQNVLAPAGNSSSVLTQLARVSLSGGVSFITNNLGNEVQSVLNRAVVSPDGTQVALDGRLSSGGTRIFVGRLTPSFGPLARVTDHPGEAGATDSFPSWVSTNQVGFLSNAGGSQSIYRVSLGSAVGPGTFLIPSALEPSYGGT